MTGRQFIVDTATQMVVKHVMGCGVPRRGFANLAWECIEGIVEKGQQGSRSYFDGASDEALDSLHAEIQEASRLKLQQLGIALDS